MIVGIPALDIERHFINIGVMVSSLILYFKGRCPNWLVPGVLGLAGVLLLGCGEAPGLSQGTDGADFICEDPAIIFAQAVELFEPGLNAGFGEVYMPGVVLGPPSGHGPEGGGSLDVVSLGVGGMIVFSFGEYQIENGEGVDFSVFENPFLLNGDAENPYYELGEVSVSQDGQTWSTFTCDLASGYPWRGCAGWNVVKSFDGCANPIEYASTGGDGFDLDDLGLDSARFVRIEDVSPSGAAPSAGFDSDGVALLNWRVVP